jgi:hypothetical protein
MIAWRRAALVTAGVLFQLNFRGRSVSIHEALLVGVM